MSCPACRAERTVPFFDGGLQPPATLARPRTAIEATSLPRLPLDYVRCVTCGHVFNALFDEAKVPASSAHPGWGMFNGAASWAEMMRETAGRLARALPRGSLVVELGHGGGEFLGMIKTAREDLRVCGYDPYGAEASGHVELRREHLDLGKVASLGAALVVVRHVLEHLQAPLDFLERIGQGQSVYLEVPCVDRAITTARTVDFFYEHAQQFTTASFVGMVERAGTIVDFGHGYDGEVVFASARLVPSPGKKGQEGRSDFEAEAHAFRERTEENRQRVRSQLAALIEAGSRIAIWGGAGKSAAFIAYYGLDADRFPIVVDSDSSKVGTFVAGTGQPIRDASWLVASPADIVIVPPQWRVRDIAREMKAKAISGSIRIEHEGRLVDFERDPHPY